MRQTRNIARAAIIFICVALAVWVKPAVAQNAIEQLLSPGPLIEGHAKLEQDCNACHKPFSKEQQDTLCLDCHKPVKSDIAQSQGFHGKSQDVKDTKCSFCHSDHKGREFKAAAVDIGLFDHRTSDFTLQGRHALVPCSACHVSGKKWREAAHDCFSCHGANEPHRGNLGKTCETCHAETGWRPAKAFDHNKTKFPLKDKHEKVICQACHIGEIYKGVPVDCNGCHKIQDVHQTKFGTDCASCHTTTGWKQAKFNHDTSTHFPLKGAHATAKCESCHGDDLLKKLPLACFDCHKKQDVHHQKLGKQCETCHNSVAWRSDVRFDHGLTNYPLIGLHVPVACESCHKDQEFSGAPTACSACHSKDDTHQGRFTSRCESCHSANGWRRVAFDHGKQTKFPLTGAHAKVACYTCHQSRNVVDASLPTNCYSCHKKQDVHRSAYGLECGRCHTTSTFKTAIIRQ